MLEIIFEDNHQLVVNKPAGILTQPSGTEQDSIEAQAKLWIKEKYQKPGNVFLEAVHRIDKPVSGIVLFGKTSKALTRLHQSLREKKSRKIYLAVVEGSFQKLEGNLEHYLIHDEHQAAVVSSQTPNSKLARLKYRVVQQRNAFSLLEIELETGRYHQIRVQLKEIGHPIVGDIKYGSRTPYMNGAIALHHYSLEVPHPISAEMQTFKAPLPDSWPFFKEANT